MTGILPAVVDVSGGNLVLVIVVALIALGSSTAAFSPISDSFQYRSNTRVITISFWPNLDDHGNIIIEPNG